MEEGEDSKDNSSRLCQSKHYQRPFKKATLTLNYQMEASEKLSSSACSSLDGRGFKKPYKIRTVCSFPEFFDEVLRAVWAVSASGNSLNTIGKKFYALSEGEMSQGPLVKVPLLSWLLRGLLLRSQQQLSSHWMPHNVPCNSAQGNKLQTWQSGGACRKRWEGDPLSQIYL